MKTTLGKITMLYQKMYRLYRKNGVYVHFSIWSTHICLETTFLVQWVNSYIHNRAVSRRIVKALQCVGTYDNCFPYMGSAKQKCVFKACAKYTDSDSANAYAKSHPRMCSPLLCPMILLADSEVLIRVPMRGGSGPSLSAYARKVIACRCPYSFNVSMFQR